MLRTLLAWCLLAASSQAELNAVEDLGLVPDDPNVDNGAIWSAAIRAGKINDGVDFPGGAYYAQTTADCGQKEGLSIEGQGIAQWNIEGEFINPGTRQPQRRGNASVRWIYTGPADQPAWRISGLGLRMTGMNIWRGWRPWKTDKVSWPLEERWEAEVKSLEGAASSAERRVVESQTPALDPRPSTLVPSTGIEIVKADPGPPAGKHDFSDIHLAGFGRGFWLRDSNNVDCLSFEHMFFTSCRDAFYCDNGQTTSIDIRGLWIFGRGETVFNLAAGGNLNVSTLGLVEPRLVFKITGGGSNVCTHRLVNLKVDNNAAGWRLVDSKGPLNLYVRGHIGNKATPADDAINVRPYMKKRQTADVDLWWGGRPWPREKEK